MLSNSRSPHRFIQSPPILTVNVKSHPVKSPKTNTPKHSRRRSYKNRRRALAIINSDTTDDSDCEILETNPVVIDLDLDDEEKTDNEAIIFQNLSIDCKEPIEVPESPTERIGDSFYEDRNGGVTSVEPGTGTGNTDTDIKLPPPMSKLLEEKDDNNLSITYEVISDASFSDGTILPADDSTVTILDDTVVLPMLDDSVVFVSETKSSTQLPSRYSLPKALNFIPIETYHTNIARIKPLTPKFRSVQDNNSKTGSTSSFRKNYNNNGYNPNRVQGQAGEKRMVIIDGSNVAFGHANGNTFSVKGIEICIEFFEKRGHEVKAVVPQNRLQRSMSTDPDKLSALHKMGKVVFTPCKNLPGKKACSYDDRFIMQLAYEFDGAIISNDNYRDLLNENEGWRRIIESRVIGFTWCNDMIILPKDPYGRNGPKLEQILYR